MPFGTDDGLDDGLETTRRHCASGGPQIVIVTNQPTPYRVELFECLGERTDLTVIYRRARESNRRWSVSQGRAFREVFASRHVRRPGRTLGLREGVSALRLLLDDRRTQAIVIGGYDAIGVTVATLFVAAIRNVPLILWSGSHTESVQDQSLLANLWRRIVFRRAAVVWAYSSRAAAFACDLGARHVVVVGNPHRSLVNEDELAGERRTDDTLRLTYVGQFTRRKHVDSVLRAVASLDAERPGSVELTMCGSGELDEIAATTPGVRCKGYLDGPELSSVIIDSDALLFPSPVDPWGLAVSEAMSLRTLVVCDERSACVPDLADGDTAIVARFEGHEDWIRVIDELPRVLRDRGQQITKAAFERVQLYSADAVANRMVESIGVAIELRRA